MFTWLLVIILAYFFFSLAFLGDKLILSGPPKPKLYTFYVGMLCASMLLFVPFIQVDLPHLMSLPWIILESIVYVIGLYSMFSALEKFEVSRTMPVIGAFQPIFILLLTFLFFGTASLTGSELVAFCLLLLGSLLISLEKRPKLTFGFLRLTLLASFMFALDYMFSKFVFLREPFFNGLLWMKMLSFSIVASFLLQKSFRREVFAKKGNLSKKTGMLFLVTQMSGGIANLLQSFAISLVPVFYLAIMNSLMGIQYVFLFLLTLLSTIFFPKILKEKISKRILLQKAASILLIVLGLGILVIK